MAVHNARIAEIFSEVADVLDIQGENPFRVRAYRNAARIVANWPRSFAEVLSKNGRLPKLPGIGSDLAGKIAEIATTGQLTLLKEIEAQTPPGLIRLLKIPGLGPKRVLLLHQKLGIRHLADLERIAKSGKLRQLPGFGAKTEARILATLSKGATATRVKLATAEQAAQAVQDYFADEKSVARLIVAGSFRRRQETVGDLDFLVVSNRPSRVMDRFVTYDEAEKVLAHGRTRSTILLRSGMQVDLRAVSARSYGAALHYFTGSKAHNIAMRTLAIRRGWKLNEYGLFRGTTRIGGETEEELFTRFGLQFIPPELRENRGEIEAAQKGRLPDLVELDQIRGDLHAHTDATDGHATLEEMAQAAEELGYEYLGVTDHSRRLAMTGGFDARRLRAQMRKIDRLNSRLRRLTVLKSIEVDILEDGKLDLPDSVLRELDYTVCSIHSKFALSSQKQTERVIRAMDDPFFTILGHPTGRLIGEREGYDLDMERIMRAAKERGCLLEVNAQPDRLDMTDAHCRLARDLGLMVSISTDAHSEQELQFMRYGVFQARRGWLEARHVVNTRPLAELKKLFRR